MRARMTPLLDARPLTRMAKNLICARADEMKNKKRMRRKNNG